MAFQDFLPKCLRTPTVSEQITTSVVDGLWTTRQEILTQGANSIYARHMKAYNTELHQYYQDYTANHKLQATQQLP